MLTQPIRQTNRDSLEGFVAKQHKLVSYLRDLKLVGYLRDLTPQAGTVNMAILTLQKLIEEHACSSQLKLFQSLYGEQVNVTEDGCITVARQFDWNWCCTHLLSAPLGNAYWLALCASKTKYNIEQRAARNIRDAQLQEAQSKFGTGYTITDFQQLHCYLSYCYAEAMTAAYNKCKEDEARMFAYFYNLDQQEQHDARPNS